MFGRDKRHKRPSNAGGDVEASQGWTGTDGPYDDSEVAELDAVVADHLDLGSLLLPVPEGGQVQVEMAQDGSLQALHLAVPAGRITVAAYAAPKSAGQWREVVAELADSLRAEKASASVEDGHWGRELFGTTPGGDLRFIGVDGPRWMIRCVVAGPSGSVGIDSELTETAREVLRGTVVRRGDEPQPVRTPLPVVLPEPLVQQLVQAQQEQVQMQAAQQAAAAGEPSPQPASEQQPRRGSQGSAMQQFDRRNPGS